VEVETWSKVMRNQKEARELDGFNWEVQGSGMYVELITSAQKM